MSTATIERPVEPGPEPLGQQVVGLPRRQRSRVVAGVGEGQAHAEQRHGQQPPGRARPASPSPRPGAGSVGSSGARSRSVAAGRRSGAVPGRCSLSMALPANPSRAGSRVRAAIEHHEHGGDARGGQADHVGLADEEEAEERDDDGPAGEEHRTARGHERRDDRVARLSALEDPLPVAGDDERARNRCRRRCRSWRPSRGRNSARRGGG